jgi:hypothetical protein
MKLRKKNLNGGMEGKKGKSKNNLMLLFKEKMRASSTKLNV